MMANDMMLWRFPSSNFGKRKGLNTGDAETFKKNPFGNFGREVIQNSLDARASDEEPVIVEFNLFKMNVKDIPDLKGLKDQIELCMEFWKESQPSFYEEYDKMLKLLNGKTIECLRISDFNTTGLVGISRPNNHVRNKYVALIKSTGVSDKNNEVSGGSKGVGKNAAFLLSKIKTLFYSTYTNEDEIGYSGVADFVSGYVKDDYNADRDHTQGDGYFGQDNKNYPIYELINFDSRYLGRGKQIGTDIFILGLNKEDDWSNEIMNSVLESFMVSILQNDLIVRIQGIEITSDTVENIISNPVFVKPKKYSYLKSQYDILKKGDNVQVFDIDTEYGSAQLLVLVSEENREYATHKCVMVRYPYMKIFDMALPKNLNVSAMCIIENNKLGKALREIENPQHNAWEPKRIAKDKRKVMEDIIESIKEQINEKIFECFKFSQQEIIDPYGAGEFLAETAASNGKNEDVHNVDNNAVEDVVEVSEIKPVAVIEINANVEQDDGEGVQPDVGASEEGGDVALHPEGHNSGGGGGYTPGETVGGSKDGDNVVMKKSPIAATRYKIMALNRADGKYRIIFISPGDYDECYLSVKRVEDELSNKSDVDILSMFCNGEDIYSENKHEYGPFAIRNGAKILLDITTNQTDYFASEVKVYASEK